MARIFITGSSDGIGLAVAKQLVNRGHDVYLHGRNAQRAQDAITACPGAKEALVGDLSKFSEAKKLAQDANSHGPYDCVIHNAAVIAPYKKTEDGIPILVAVNLMAPYILTCLLDRPKHHLYVSSGLHTSGKADFEDIVFAQRGEKGYGDYKAYCDSKLHISTFANAVARHWPDTKSNSLDPGWIATKMGGAGATGDLQAGVDTYVMLAESTADQSLSGKYFRPHKTEAEPHAATKDGELQEKLLRVCEEVTGLKFPS